jgi:hypothetical protein
MGYVSTRPAVRSEVLMGAIRSPARVAKTLRRGPEEHLDIPAPADEALLMLDVGTRS